MTILDGPQIVCAERRKLFGYFNCENKPSWQGSAECSAEKTYMIGDRLDNDIEPAAKLGMNTIWVKQGSFADGNVNLIEYRPDIIVDSIDEILKYL